MKKIISTLAILGLAITFIACSPDKVSTTEISVLIDSTDKLIAYPKGDDIMKLFDFSDLWYGRIFRQSYLTDVTQNQSKVVSIEAKNNWKENLFLRENQVKEFKRMVAEIVKPLDSNTTSKSNSKIYVPLSRELNRLSQSKSSTRILIVFSDLLEHTPPDMSFYDSKQFAMLESNPGEIARYFEKQVTLNSLKGIEVWLVFQPAKTNDKRFQVASEFYSQLLQSKGASVHVTANL